MQQTYSIPEAIAALRMSRNTLYDEISAGRLRSYTVGRRRYISAGALAEYIREREREAERAGG